MDICVIDMPLLDTRNGKDLLGTFIADLVLQILSFCSENERVNIKKRQAEGIVEAKKRGVRFGRPKRKLTKEFFRQRRRWQTGRCTAKVAARNCGMPLSTFYCKCKLLKNKQENPEP